MNEIRIGRLLGIEVSIDPSWLVIVFLFGWSFYAQFEMAFPDSPTAPLVLTAAAPSSSSGRCCSTRSATL